MDLAITEARGQNRGPWGGFHRWGLEAGGGRWSDMVRRWRSVWGGGGSPRRLGHLQKDKVTPNKGKMLPVPKLIAPTTNLVVYLCPSWG
jgi:hypothetical protein